MAEIDSLEIKIGASSNTAVEKINAIASSLEKLKKAGGGDLSETAKKIEAIARATSSLKGNGEDVKKFADGLKSLEGLGRIKIPDKLAEKLTALSEASQGIPKASENLSGLANAINGLSNLGKVNIPKTLPDRIIDIGAAVEQLSTESIKQLDSFTASLQRLSGIDLKGLPGAIRAVQKSASGNPIEDSVKKTINDARLQSIKTDQQIYNLQKRLSALSGKSGTPDYREAEIQLSALRVAAEQADEQARLLQEQLDRIKAGNTDGAVAKIQELTSALKDAQAEAKIAGEAVKSALEKAKDATSTNTSKTGEVQPGQASGDAENRANALARILEKLKVIDFASNIKKQFSEAESSADSFKKALSSDNTLGTIFDGAKKSVIEATSQIMAANPKVAAFVLTIKVAYDAIRKYFNEIKKDFEQLKSWLQSAGQQIGTFAKQAFSDLGDKLKSVGDSIASKFTNPFQKAIDVFQKWKSAIGRVAFYRMVRSAIKAVTDGFKTGIENLYQYSKLVGTEFAPAMNQLATSALYLKNSLGAMAAPLIQALAPAIDFVVDKLVTLFNMIGKVMAALTGKTVFSQAKKHAVEYEDAAKGAAKATKEFQRYLIGIDELNIITEPNDGGGGGSALEDYGSMFEEVELPDWAKRIKENIEKGDWYGAGRALANHLNSLLDQWDAGAWGKKLGKKINHALDFSYGFLKNFKFEKFGTKIAQELNSLISTINWSMLGRTFAAGWNAIFDTAYGFVTTFDWKKFGNYIGAAINGYIGEINLEKAGQTLGVALRGILTTAITVLTETDWSGLVAKFGDAINAFLTEYGKGQSEGYDFGVLLADAFNSGVMALDSFLNSGAIGHLSEILRNDIADFVSTIQLEDAAGTLANLLDNLVDGAIDLFGDDITWATLGQKIGASLKEFFMGDHDWISGVGTLLGTIIHDAVTAIENFADQFTADDWVELGNRVAQSVNNFFQEMTPEDWGNLGEALHSLGDGILTGVATAVNNISSEDITNAVGAFMDKLDITSLQEKFHEVFRQIYDKFHPIVSDIFFEIGGFVWTGFWQGLEDKINEMITNVRDFFDSLVKTVKDYLGIESPSTVFAEIGGYVIEGFLKGISDTWHTIIDFFTTKLPEWWENNIKPWFTLEKWQGIAGNIETAVTGAWDSTVGAWAQSISTWWDNDVSPWFSAEKWRNLGTSALSSLKSGMEELWGKIKSWWDGLSLPQLKLKMPHFSWTSQPATGWIANVLSAIGLPTSLPKLKVSWYAKGGFPDKGKLFVAGEAGPEMVGSMGNKTTVANNLQIIEGISAGVKAANIPVVSAIRGLTSTMSAQYSGLRYDVPKPSFSGVSERNANYRVAYAGGYQDPQSGNYAEAAGGTNADVVNAILAMATQIVTAINEKDTSVNIDGERLTRRISSLQAQQERMYRR